MVSLLTKDTSKEGQDGRMCGIRAMDRAYMIASVCMNTSRLEHPLNILNIFRNSGPGSLSLTTTWNNRRCTMSYIPTRCSGISPSASSYRIVTFGGSHCFCGQPEMSMSKPSSCAVGEMVRARSSSQIL